MTDILFRAELHNPEQARAILARQALPWVGEQLKQGRELVAEFRLLDDDITDKQRAYLHGVVLTEIALQARPDGQRFDMKVWKEFLRDKFLGFKTVTHKNPLTGKKVRRRERVSTEDLGVRRMAEIARKLNPSIEIVLRTHSEDESQLLTKEGIGKVFFGEEELARGMTSHVLERFAPAGAGGH